MRRTCALTPWELHSHASGSGPSSIGRNHQPKLGMILRSRIRNFLALHQDENGEALGGHKAQTLFEKTKKKRNQ
jgi:hypothetical protein